MRILTLLAVLALFATSAFGQVTTAKPDCSSYTVNTGLTHSPDHFWPICEGAGTTLTDEGSGTAYTMVFAAGGSYGNPTWDTGEATHGTVLDFLKANAARAADTTIDAVSGTQVFCVVGWTDTLSTDMGYMAIADQSATNYLLNKSANDGDMSAQAVLAGAFSTNTSNEVVDNSTWHLQCVRGSESTIDLSTDGSAWDVLAWSGTGLMATLDIVGLGGRLDNGSGASDLTASIAAAFWYHGDKSSAELSTIYNSGDPWPIIGMTAGGGGSNTAALRRRRH